MSLSPWYQARIKMCFIDPEAAKFIIRHYLDHGNTFMISSAAAAIFIKHNATTKDDTIQFNWRYKGDKNTSLANICWYWVSNEDRRRIINYYKDK